MVTALIAGRRVRILERAWKIGGPLSASVDGVALCPTVRFYGAHMVLIDRLSEILVGDEVVVEMVRRLWQLVVDSILMRNFGVEGDVLLAVCFLVDFDVLILRHCFEDSVIIGIVRLMIINLCILLFILTIYGVRAIFHSLDVRHVGFDFLEI